MIFIRKDNCKVLAQNEIVYGNFNEISGKNLVIKGDNNKLIGVTHSKIIGNKNVHIGGHHNTTKGENNRFFSE